MAAGRTQQPVGSLRAWHMPWLCVSERSAVLAQRLLQHSWKMASGV